MESSRSKVELAKPVFLMAGIPLAFSVAALILAKITAKKTPYSKPSPPVVDPADSMERCPSENDLHKVYEDEGSFCGHDLTTFLSLGDGYTLTNTQMRNSWEEEILGLRRMIKELQEREWEVEAQFLRYQDLEQEFVVYEFQIFLLLELARVEHMDREVSLMEAENQRFDNMVTDYLRTLEELESSKLENGMLQRKVKKLLKRMKERSRVISEQNLLIEAKEAVISRNGMGLEREANTIKGLKEEIEELQTAIRRLQEEKNELLKKLDMAKNSASLKNEAERETMDDYSRVINELEQLQKDRAVEIKELINLRWRNACLRHELLKRSTNQEQDGNQGLKNYESGINVDFGGSAEMGRFSLESGSNSSVLTQSESSLGINKGDRVGHSKSRSLYGKLKKWMDANERVKKQKPEEKKKPELKFFGSHSVADFGEETHFPTMKPSTDII